MTPSPLQPSRPGEEIPDAVMQQAAAIAREQMRILLLGLTANGTSWPLDSGSGPGLGGSPAALPSGNAPMELVGDEGQEPTFQNFLSLAREQAHIWLVGVSIGLLLGFVMYLATPRTYQAKGTFLVDQLPFTTTTETANDPETSREMVQSLILSIPGREIKRAIALRLRVLPSALSFNDKERAISLRGFDSSRANIKVAATRNSRLGTITVESCNPEFATKVVNTLFDEILTMNTLAGRLAEVQSQLTLTRGTSAKLVDTLATVTSERVRLEEEVRELDAYTAKKLPLAEFSAFSNDTTINNLKTQLNFVESEYYSLATYSTRACASTGSGPRPPASATSSTSRRSTFPRPSAPPSTSAAPRRKSSPAASPRTRRPSASSRRSGANWAVPSATSASASASWPRGSRKTASRARPASSPSSIPASPTRSPSVPASS